MSNIELVKSVLSNRLDVSALKETDSLSLLGLDSLDLVEIVLEIEEKLGVDFTSEEISKLETVKDVLKLIETKAK